MNWMTIIWSMLASASIMIGLMHLFLWRRSTTRDYYLFSSLMAVAAGGVALTELALAQTSTLSAVPGILRLGNISIGVTVVAMVWFLHRYLATGRRVLLLLITGLWAGGLVVNFISPGSLVFSEVTGILDLTTFWGEPYHLVVGSGNPWKILPDLASLLVAIFVIDASIHAWKLGHKRQAGITGGAISFFIIAAGIHTPLVDAGIVKTPYMISLAFVAIVAALNYEMVLDAANALRQTRENAAGQRRWNSLLANVQLAVVDVDPNGAIRYANPYFIDRTGYDIDHLQGRFMVDLIPPDQKAEFLEQMRQGASGHPRPFSRWPVVSTQSSILMFDWSTVGLRTVDGDTDGLLTIGADVTDQVKTLRELDQTRRDLDRVNRANVLGEFVSAIAHELNQPLTAILANAQVAVRYLDDAPPLVPDTRELLDLIIRDDKRAAEVIRRLHDLVARGKVERENLDLNSVVNETMELCDREIRDRGVEVSLDLDPDLKTVLAGRIEFQQIVLNLLHNALQSLEKVDPGNRRILMTTRSRPDGVRFTIEDTGIGFSETSHQDLFSPFTGERAGGIGMGLAICRRITEAHGGMIHAEPMSRGGARFIVEFPTRIPQEVSTDG